MKTSEKTEKPTGLALLREPFPANQISKLPKPLKKRDEMDKLPKASCKVCGGYHATSNIIHLDYVGHAALTDRLLDADPGWTWEPLGFTPDGLPATDRNGGLWIKLTVCGLSRLGYGHAGDKTGGDAVKELIGDALRNAAMRFGAALDLWHKGELHADDDEPKPEKPATFTAPAPKPTKMAPAGYHFLSDYTQNGDWHEAHLLNWDDQGGNLKISTKRQQLGALLMKLAQQGEPVKADVTMKKGSKGEAYLNSINSYAVDQATQPIPIARIEAPGPVAGDEIPFR